VKPLVSYPDVEREVLDWLETDLAAEGYTVTVGVPVPQAWVKGSTTHVQVAVDEATLVHPVIVKALVRITVWDDASTEAKRVANAAQAILLSNSDGGVTSVTGVVATHDPDTRAELATFTVLTILRSDPSLIS
jgi:hypothetical protein